MSSVATNTKCQARSYNYKALLRHIKRCSPAPPVLYRYMDIKGAIKLLTSMKLRYSDPGRFDDIFEHSCRRSTNIRMRNFHDRIKPCINSKDNFINSFLKRLATYSNGEKITNNVAVLCLSESWDINIMWAIYGSKHRGVVFGIRSDYLYPVKKVKYIQKKENMITPESEIEYAQNLVFTKTMDWSWQKEWRSIIKMRHNQKTTTRPITPEDIVEICIGIGCNENYGKIDSDHLEFEHLIKEKNIHAKVYACMKDLTTPGEIKRILIEK